MSETAKIHINGLNEPPFVGGVVPGSLRVDGVPYPRIAVASITVNASDIARKGFYVQRGDNATVASKLREWADQIEQCSEPCGILLRGETECDGRMTVDMMITTPLNVVIR